MEKLHLLHESERLRRELRDLQVAKRQSELSWALAKKEFERRLLPLRLIVKVNTARNLPALDWNGLSDPFCVLRFMGQKQETPIVRKTLNPAWNSAHIFEVPMQYLQNPNPREVLSISLFDYDFLRRNDAIGTVNVFFNAIERYYQDVQFRFVDNWYRIEPARPSFPSMFISLAFAVEYR